MRFRRSSLLRLLFWVCLFLLAVRPIARVERGVEWATSPLRLMAETGAPVVWFHGHRVRAAEGEGRGRAMKNSIEIEALAAELLSLARPTDPALMVGREWVPAEVIGRAPGDRDCLRVRVTDTTALVPGLPAVHGNTYVGRVARVDAALGVIEIDLVTGPRFAVGARLLQPPGSRPIWMTIGGVHSARGSSERSVERLALAVRNPSDREAPDGPVEVAELLADIDPWAYLAQGYGLGRLSTVESREERILLADIDYGAGLYHVHILCPEGSRGDARNELELAVSDRDWQPARRLSVGDPSAWRGGLKLDSGLAEGVRPGAAVIRGLRLVGRVERAGNWSSDVRLLSDPGLSLVAVARVSGAARPTVLGRLISLGVDASGAWIRFRWEAVVGFGEPGGGAASVEAQLFTGAGDSGLPVGLFIGDARLVPGADPELGVPLVLVRLDPDRGAGNLWVRTAGEHSP